MRLLINEKKIIFYYLNLLYSKLNLNLLDLIFIFKNNKNSLFLI